MAKRQAAVELTHEQGVAFLDREARAKLGISGSDFLRRHDQGLLDRSDQAVLDVEILIPFAR